MKQNTTLHRAGFYPQVCSDLSRISTVFGQLWGALGFDLTDEEIRRAILSNPTIRNHRDIFISTHREEPSSYALAQVFNCVADRFFKRDNGEPANSPLEVRYMPVLPVLRPIPEKWQKYVQVVQDERITELLRTETRIFTRKQRIPLEPETQWDPEHPVYPEPQRYRYKEVQEKHVLPVYRSVSFPQLVFCEEFTEIYNSYTLDDQEQKRYDLLQDIADRLNKVLGKSGLGAHLPALFEYDYQAKKVRPSKQYNETIKSFLYIP